MSSPALKIHRSPQDYLTFERQSPGKHEYENGKLHAMAGASRKHNLISGNLYLGLRTRLRNRRCEAFMSDMRVLIEETGLYTYPDVVVSCGQPAFQDAENDTLLNPTFIAEILSPSTESYDRGRKFAHYRRLPSLQEYALIAQDRPFVELWRRQKDDWAKTECRGCEETVRLESIGCEIPLAEL